MLDLDHDIVLEDAEVLDGQISNVAADGGGDDGIELHEVDQLVLVPRSLRALEAGLGDHPRPGEADREDVGALGVGAGVPRQRPVGRVDGADQHAVDVEIHMVDRRIDLLDRELEHRRLEQHVVGLGRDELDDVVRLHGTEQQAGDQKSCTR